MPKMELSRDDEVHILGILLEKAGAPAEGYPYSAEFSARELLATGDFEAAQVRLFGSAILTPLSQVPTL